MKSSVSATQLGRRANVAVLAIMAIAVAMLGLLVAQTSQQSGHRTLMNLASRQRMLSERLISQLVAKDAAAPEARDLWRKRIATTMNEWELGIRALRGRDSSRALMLPTHTKAAQAYLTLMPLQHSLLVAAKRAAAANDAQNAEALIAQQRQLAAAMEDVIAALEIESAHQLDRLVQLEAACVIILLIALGIVVRLALQPTQEQLTATINALAESESRTRAVLDAMQEGMVITESTGEIIGWNPSALRILQVEDAPDPASAIREVALALTNEHGEVLGPERLPSRLTMEQGAPLTDVTLVTTDKRGESRWLSANTHPLYRAEGEAPHAAVTTFRDVSFSRRVDDERIAQAQAMEMQNQELLSQAEALERGNALFRSLVETAGSAIVGLDTHGRVFEWNREAEALYGVSRAEALGRDYAQDLVTLEHRTKMREGITAVLAGQPIRNLLGPVRSVIGERHMVLWNIAPLQSADDGAVHGLIAAGLDVTEREASDERFRLLFERSTDAHLLYDAAGIIDCNEATLHMLRLADRDSLLGRHPSEFFPHRQPDGRLSVVIAAQMKERARIFGHHRFEWTYVRDDGTEFPVEATLTPLRLQGKDVILAVWHDIAERKRVEDALRLAKDAAESANKTKSEFMTRMNHELRTPLTAIIGFSRVLLQGRAGTLSQGAQLYTERIRDNGMHLLSLINQILDVAKVEAGRMELERDVVALDALVNETLAMLESTADTKGLTLRRELPAHLAPLVTDAGKLRQILINLVGNAIKFTAKGEVSVRVIADEATGDARAIVVKDTGIGIPEDRRGKIFEPFEQGDSSTRREFGGTGLGLSIVKTFAQLIGATVEVDSVMGEGTTFTINLPEPATMQPDAELPASAPELSGARS